MKHSLIFLGAFFLSAPFAVDICSGYLNYYNLDLQEFLLWNYTSLNNLLPYRDIFYPYGLFSYFKNYNALLALLYFLISPILFTIAFFLFKKIIKEKLILYSSFIILYLFVFKLIGFQTFSRYGILALISLLFSYIFYSSVKIRGKTLFFLGAILALFFSFITDIGIYLILSFMFIYAFNAGFKSKRKHFLSSKLLIDIVKDAPYVGLGFLIGIIPLFLFLIYHGGVYQFFDYFRDVGRIVLVAKTPFFTFIDSPANIFTVSILSFAIFFNFLKIFFFKTKPNLSSYFQIILIFDILILEYKSIIRSIDGQIAFVALLLLMFLVYEIVSFLIKNDRNRRIIYISLVTIITIIYGASIEKPVVNLSHLSENVSHLANNTCFEKNLKVFSKNNPDYVKIVNLIKKQPNFNGKIFSFPTGDSAFYVLLNQKPPFYNAIFEGSSAKNQAQTVKYIQDNRIEYVAINTHQSVIQDGVADYIRQRQLFKYLLNNYHPFAVIGNHIILKKEENSDFFASVELGGVKNYKKYLMDVNLKKIPYSEGIYKYRYLEENNKLIIEGSDISKINFFIKSYTTHSANKIVVLIPSVNQEPNSSNFIKFQTQGGFSTIILFDSCKENAACIINLGNVPLFYKNRVVTKISLDKEFKGVIKIFDLKTPSNLW